jgi:uncharacterized alkaline shock family protein YloU
MADDYFQEQGITTIAPEVLVTIARLTTLNTPGVSRMSSHPAKVNRLIRRGEGEGVRVEVKDGQVTTDLYVVMMSDVNMRDVSRNIQNSVARAIEEMVGMDVGRVNVHIEDIDFPEL